MKKQYRFILTLPAILLLLTLTAFTSSSENKALQKGDLVVKLDNIRNNNGVIYVFLYNYENQYPHKPYTYYKVSKARITDGRLNVRISDISFRDKYAITLIDDENDNEDLDRFLGLPTEGFGFSNNIHPLFSLPNYEDLLFSFNEEKSINIELQYFL